MSELEDTPNTRSRYTAYFRLAVRHRRFVDAYCEHGNATEAFKVIRYRGKNANYGAKQLMKRPDIKAAIAEREYHMLEASSLKVERLVLEIAKAAFEPIDTKPSWSEKLKAQEMLAKLHRLFGEGTNVNVAANGRVSITVITGVPQPGEQLAAPVQIKPDDPSLVSVEPAKQIENGSAPT